MFKLIAHRLGKLGVWGVGCVLIGGAYNASTALYPLTKYPPIPETWARVGFWSSIGIGVTGAVLVVISLYRPTVENLAKTIGLRDIVPTLQKMHIRIMELAHIEAEKYFDLVGYQKVNNQFNEILGVSPSNPDNVTKAKVMFSRMESRIKKNMTGKGIKELLDDMTLKSAILDNSGFGLKKQKTQDKEYKRILADLTFCRNIISDVVLNSLIKEHIEVSETAANMVLTIERSLKITASLESKIIRIPDVVNPKIIGQVEQLEKTMNEYLAVIRLDINQRINELEKTSEGK